MLRQLIHRKEGQQEICEEQQLAEYFPSFEGNLIGPRDQTVVSQTVNFHNFACLDRQSSKLLLNLNNLAEFRNDRMNFIATIGCTIANQSDNVVNISESPVTVINGISYFLLSTQSTQNQIIKLMFMLSQSIYLSYAQLPQFQSVIQKAIDKDHSWDFTNNLYLTNYTLQSGSTVTSTMAETIQMKKNTLPTNNHSNMEQYFSNISYLQGKRHTLEIQDIIEMTKVEYNAFTSRAYLYQSILNACTNLLPNPGPLFINLFQDMNSEELSTQLFQQSSNNFQIFTANIMECMKKYKFMEYSLGKFKREILQPFNQWDMTWLSNTQFFKSQKKMMEETIEEFYQQIPEMEKSKMEKIHLKQLADLIQKEGITSILGNHSLNAIEGLQFQTYLKSFKDKIHDLIKKLGSSEWRGQNNSLTSNKGLLANLQARIEINERKKVSLEEGIELVEKQQEYLKKLLSAYTSKVQVH